MGPLDTIRPRFSGRTEQVTAARTDPPIPGATAATGGFSAMIDEAGTYTEVTVTGAVDRLTNEEFAFTVTEACDGATKLVVLVMDVEFVCARGLHVISMAAQTLRERGGQLAVCGPPSMIGVLQRLGCPGAVLSERS